MCLYVLRTNPKLITLTGPGIDTFNTNTHRGYILNFFFFLYYSTSCLTKYLYTAATRLRLTKPHSLSTTSPFLCVSQPCALSGGRGYQCIIHMWYSRPNAIFC